MVNIQHSDSYVCSQVFYWKGITRVGAATFIEILLLTKSVSIEAVILLT